jgi:hypothetical protein
VYGAGAVSGARAVLIGCAEASTARRLSERKVERAGVVVLLVGGGCVLLVGGFGVRGSWVGGEVVVLGGEVDGGLDTGFEGVEEAFGAGLEREGALGLDGLLAGGLDLVDIAASWWCGGEASGDILRPRVDVGRDDGSECW